MTIVGHRLRNHSENIMKILCLVSREWKFARTKLWISYFEAKSILPPPFNILPTVRGCCTIITRVGKGSSRDIIIVIIVIVIIISIIITIIYIIISIIVIIIGIIILSSNNHRHHIAVTFLTS